MWMIERLFASSLNATMGAGKKDAGSIVMEISETLEGRDERMASTSIADTTKISGFIGACLVDGDSGLMLASEGGGRLDMNMVAALNTDFVKAKQNAIDELGLNQGIEDILITLEKQIHLIRPLERNPAMFVYVALDKASANLGMARMQLKKIEHDLKI